MMSNCSSDSEKTQSINTSVTSNASIAEEKILTKEGNKVSTRFNAPPGYERVNKDSTSFAFFLQNLPLKPPGALVKYYNGESKAASGVYEAVVDLQIGNKNLHQCADAIMRLKADYLRSQNMEDEIHFNFTNGMQVDYQRWKNGERISVSGNNTKWVNTGSVSNSDENYWKYLETIFSYAGTQSLEKELAKISTSEIQIGDIFIQGGAPGHAVIIVDMAMNTSGEKVFLIAQSYMPAQEIQILINPSNNTLSPWYSIANSQLFKTPEWTFELNDLMRFQD